MKSKLLRDNLPEYMTQIPFGTLPRVFQDAVQIVARFGMVYVWIDSLCIIQDSRRDWAAESAQMGLIYQNSFCNIAATGFADGTAGLFADRDASLLTPIPLELESDIYHVSEDAEGKARRQKEIEAGKYLLVDVDMFRNGVDNAPLNRRGWVVQERSLSPRTLHFGSNQLYWECAQKIACEVFPQGLSRGMPRVNAKRLGPLTPAPIEEVVTEEKMQEDRDTQEMINNMSKRELRRYPPSVRRWLKQRVTNPDGKPKLPTQRLMRKNIRGMTLVQHRWRDVVQNFSGCALTFSSDKLIAIAGLAQEAAEAMQCDYLTGLWRDDLEHQLLWRVTDARPKPKLTGCRGPSWSWASIDGPVTLSDWSGSGYQTKEGEIEWYTQVIEAATKAASGNIYGQIGSGSLKMTGRLGVLRIKKDDAPLPDPADENLVHIERQARIHWDTQDLEHQYCPSGDHVVWRYTTYTTPASTTQCVSRYLDVFVMPVRIMEEDPDGRDWEAPLLVGLLLLPTRKRKGQYRRVGLIEATQHWYGDNAVKPFTNTTKIRETAFFAAAGDAEGEYVVEIV
jgi:Heterokaryon incompatibility protein (HET)